MTYYAHKWGLGISRDRMKLWCYQTHEKLEAGLYPSDRSVEFIRSEEKFDKVLRA
jgi:hypothetical protein